MDRDLAWLEIHFLANPAGDLHFALLSDWTDAPEESANGVTLQSGIETTMTRAARPPASLIASSRLSTLRASWMRSTSRSLVFTATSVFM